MKVLVWDDVITEDKPSVLMEELNRIFLPIKFKTVHLSDKVSISFIDIEV